LIIQVIGPTKWIRWELDTIIERDALSKLIILMPPGWPDDRAARWQNVISALQPTRWGSSLAMVDPETVIAIGFFDDGGLSIVTGGKRRHIDYLLAFRLVLYQLKNRLALTSCVHSAIGRISFGSNCFDLGPEVCSGRRFEHARMTSASRQSPDIGAAHQHFAVCAN
jgi:hypothetical protein